MIGGMSRIDRDVPPFVIVEGNPSRIRAFHQVGPQRSGFSPEDISLLKKAYRTVFRSGLTMNEALERLDSLPENEHIQHFQQFIQRSLSPGRRGLIPSATLKSE
jgi:UDP-N-acetylglucosamine acyltransferase